MRKSNLKLVSVVLLLIGAALVTMNFFIPHTVSVQKPVQLAQQVGTKNFTQLASKEHFNFITSGYVFFPSVHIDAGAAISLSWESDVGATAYVFTPDQFSVFQSKFPDSDTFYGYRSEAAYSAIRHGSLVYNVSQSGDFVAVLSFRGSVGEYVAVGQFNEYLLTYAYQTQYTTEIQMVPQGDDLYLYLGLVFVISGTATLVVFLLKKE